MKSEVISLFGLPVVVTNIDRDFTKDELQLLFFDVPMYKNEQKVISNHQSKDYYLFDSYSDILKDIKNFCECQLKSYLEEIEGVDTDLAGLRITQSWLNKNKSGESHHMHSHKNSYLSGVLYISCLPNDSINFNNRSFGMYNNIEFPQKKSTNWNTNIIQINVTEGELMIFPSWIQHYVDLNKTKNRERISLAFNTFPIGEMGKYYKAAHLKL